ncbi:MAG: ATP-binding protein [Nanoarchaeota archaeon]
MYIEREIKEKFEKIAKAYSVVAIVGARQSGKTTFLKEHSKSINSSYLLFDDPDIRFLFEEDIKKFEKQYLESFNVYILDEVQYCKGAGRNLKYLADNGKKMWITSSSELILSKEVLSYLVGRVSILKLYPLSIQEFLNAKGQKELTKQILERNIWEHITFGGYPKVVLSADIELKKTILRDLYQTMVLKDIANTFSIEDINSLEEFTKYLSINIGNLISYEEVSNSLKISFQTAKKYLNAMEKSYLIVRVPPFYKNKTKEITKQPKIYFIDTGLRNLIAKSFNSEPDGKTFENYVASEIIKAGFELKHWRTKSKAEVDFIIEKEGELIPVEVKLNSPHKIERSLRAFIEAYKPKRAFIIYYKGENKTLQADNCKVFFTDILNFKKSISKKRCATTA